MAVDFNALLSPEQKQQLLSNLIQQYAAEGMKQELNKKVIEKSEDPNKETALAEVDSIINTCSNAIEVYQEELASLG